MKKWDRRNKPAKGPEPMASPLPVDYLRLVEKTMTEALAKGLGEIQKTYPISTFQANGSIYGDEVLVVVTLSHGKDNIVATTVYASADYRPTSEIPSLEDTLSACVDAAGFIFDYYLDPTKPELVAQIAHASLGAMEDAPFEWTPADQTAEAKSKVRVWVKMDKSNPQLDQMADEWLAKNDPDFQKSLEQELEQSEEFLNERLEAIKKAKGGHGGGMGNPGGSGSGPIRH